jgi:hypothetical protein
MRKTIPKRKNKILCFFRKKEDKKSYRESDQNDGQYNPKECSEF